jgi:class 3 adenylate cyclase/sugar lactone lactonase YvrE
LVRRYRREAELTQEALAERAGLSVRLVRDIEAGSRHRPREDTVRLLADALGLSGEERAGFERVAREVPRFATEASGFPESSAGRSAPQVLTFLIADIRGYSRFTEEQGDEEAAALTMRFAHIAREMVEAREGQIVELRGDEILAVFSSVRQALRAAVDLQARLAHELADNPSLPLRVGIGLDTGEVVAVDGGYRGAALNLASRLCSLAGPGEVLISAGVVHLVRKLDGLSYVERGEVQIKGFAEPVRVTQLVPDEDGAGLVAATEERSPPIGSFLGALPDSPMVERQDELAALSAGIDAVLEGTGQLVILSGDMGVGKTRLAQEVTLLVRDRGFLVATGRCYEEEGTTPYFPFREALATAFVAAPVGIRAQAQLRWPALGGVLPESMVVQPTAGGDEPEERLRLFAAVAGFLAVLADVRPVALLLDDLHWADPESLGLWQYLARQTRAYRVLLLGTYRPEEGRGNEPLDRALRALSRERLAQRLTVHRLPAEGTAAMIAASIGDAESSAEFAAYVHRRTKGNPFYITEILRALGGHYRLVREIGAGGMGHVFEAVDVRSGKHVAAKIMFARTEIDLDALLRFEQEGAVLATLKHPNIVEVYGTFMEEHASCIVMELLEGRSLGDLMRMETLSLKRIKRLAVQVAAALAHAHARKIIHRDIKPDNIMVGPDDHVTVTDFGIARVVRPETTIHTMTSTGTTLGTPLYMAPEQVEGQRVDGRADVYALGAVLYAMVTGGPPFQGDDPLTIAFKHVNDPPQPPSEINSHIPRDWDQLILKALAKDPAQRYSTAGALQRALTELSVPVARDGREPLAAQARPARRHRARRISLAAGALVLAGAAAAGVHSLGRGASTHAAIGAPVANWGVQQKIGRFSSLFGVAVDAAGNLYLTDQLDNRVIEMSPQGQPLLTWGSSGSGMGQFSQAGSIAVDPSGNTYVIDNQGNRVEEFGQGGTPLASFGGTGSGPGELNVPQAIAVDGKGHIYVADTGNHRIEEFFASGKPGKTFKTWPQPFIQPNGPGGVATDMAGNVYVSVSQQHVVEKFASSGKQLATISGPGIAFGQLSDPRRLAVDRKGNIYVFDQQYRLQEFSSNGKPLRLLASATGPTVFNTATSLAVDASGNVYVIDSGYNRIEQLAPGRRSFAPLGTQAASPPSLTQPNGVAVDGRGYVYVADTGHNRIWQLSPTGRLLALLGDAGQGPGKLSSPYGVAADARGDLYVADTGNSRIAVFSAARHEWSTLGVSVILSAPYGVALDGRGNVYVADAGNQQVYELSPRGRVLRTWGASVQTAGIAPGEFHNPYALAVDGQGNLYVADELNNRIQELRTNARTWTVLSTGSLQLNAPTGVAIDHRGNIDVVDSTNHRIVELSPAGKLLGTVGGKGAGPGQLSGPTAIAFDGHGNAYVTDTGNNRVLKFAPRP